MYKRTLRILSCGGGGRSPGRATLNSVERVLLAAAVSSCSMLGRLLRQLQMTARTRRAVAIAASGCADLGAGRVELHIIERVPLLDPCCQWQERRKIDCGCALAIAATVATAFALRLRCPRRFWVRA